MMQHVGLCNLNGIDPPPSMKCEFLPMTVNAANSDDLVNQCMPNFRCYEHFKCFFSVTDPRTHPPLKQFNLNLRLMCSLTMRMNFLLKLGILVRTWKWNIRLKRLMAVEVELGDATLNVKEMYY